MIKEKISAGPHLLHLEKAVYLVECHLFLLQFSSVQFSGSVIVRLFATAWTITHQASLSITNSQSPPKLMSIESLLLFLMFQWMLAIWSLVPLPFLKPAWTSGSSRFTYCWSLAWRILSITLLTCEISAIVRYFEHSLALPFFGIGMKMGLFQSCGHGWVSQICWHIECSTFTAASFRIWNSSAGIPSPPLALLLVMLPKAHLTSHSRMSGSRWVITPPWLSGSWRSFLYSSSAYSYHLFLISSASVRSIPFLSFIEPIFARSVPLVSLIFLKRSLVFPILLVSFISLC